MKILIVDDNRDDRTVLRYMVERNGHEALEAEDGFIALKKAKDSAPDLIISDALMPVMDGFQFLRAVKQDSNLRSIPFVFYSSSYKEYQDVRLAMSLGADAYIIKPVEPVELWRKIQSLLGAEKTEKVPPVPLIKEDAEYLKRYSEVVATKLEDKVRELERTLAERNRAEEAHRESERRYRDIFDNILDGLYLLEVTEDGRFRTIEVNPALERMTGIPRSLSVGKTQEEIAPGEAARIVNEKYRRCVESGRTTEEEVELDLPSGRYTFHSTLIPARDSAGRVYRIIGISRDITERKQAEQRIALLNFALNNVHDEAYLINEQARFDFVNDESCRALGYSRAELLGMTVTDVDPDFPTRERWFEHWKDLKMHGSLTFEGRHKARDGRVFPVEIKANYFEYLGHGYNLALVGDITERKRNEAALRASEQNLALHVMQTPLGVIEWNLDFKVTKWNPAAERIFGYSRKEALGAHASLIVPSSVKDHVNQIFSDLIRQKGGLRSTNENMTKDGRLIYCEWYNTPLVDANGNVIAAASLVQDITERKLSIDALQKSEAFNRNILDSVDEGFIVVDRQYRIMSANRAFCHLVKLPEDRVVGRPCYEMTHNAPRPCFESGEDCAVKRTFETDAIHFSSHTHMDASGAKQYVELRSYPITDASGTVVSAIETVNDITEKRKLEDQLRQAQKMEAIGTLAGGVAHDFNNILTAIIGYSNIVKMKMNSDDPLQSAVDQVLTSSDRAAHLTHSLLAFSRKQVINPKPVDLNDIVRNIEKLLRRLIGEDIDLSTQIAETSLIAMADAGQIEQVLMNLATNARDAMPEGGALTIRTEEIELGADFITAHGSGKPGKYALISVSDTGQGMDATMRDKIFEPFFTTKELGKGTGLGLAIVYGIVKQHEGAVNVYSEPGKGTTFRIYLPLIVTSVKETSAEKAAPPRGGTEAILLAEDDTEVRNIITIVLKNFGYRVIEAVDGQDALDKFAATGKEIDLMILDVIMPRKSGKEVYDAVRAVRPDLAVLFVSGYTADIVHKKGIFEEGIEFLSKPVSPHDLLRKIREVLDKHRQAG